MIKVYKVADVLLTMNVKQRVKNKNMLYILLFLFCCTRNVPLKYTRSNIVDLVIFFCLRLWGKEDVRSTISKYRRYGITLLA